LWECEAHDKRPTQVIREWFWRFFLAGVLGVALSIAMYPGGTWFDAHTRGFALWDNFMCDMLPAIAVNGEPNPAHTLAALSMATLALSLAPFFIVLSKFAASRAMAMIIAILGCIGALNCALVALAPGDAYPGLHATLIFIAGPPCFVALVLGASQLRFAKGSMRERIAVGLACALAVVSLSDFAVYAHHMAAHTPPFHLLPALQKIAMLLLLVWMVVVATIERPRATHLPG
jgi:hypothetical protein